MRYCALVVRFTSNPALRERLDGRQIEAHTIDVRMTPREDLAAFSDGIKQWQVHEMVSGIRRGEDVPGVARASARRV